MPYESHPVLNTPPDETPIWRYMSLAKFMALMGSRCLYFSRADKLGDPFEGSALRNSTYEIVTYNESGIEISRVQTPHSALPEGQRKVMAQSRRAAVESTYVSCWYSRPHDSTAMWTIYGSNDEGIAIRSTIRRLKDSLAGSGSLRVGIGQVSYVDFEALNLDWENNALIPFVRKRLSFEHEREVRALFISFAEGDAHSIGVNIPVDLSTLIEEIVIAPQAQSWFADVVKEILSRYELDVTPRYSPLADIPYWGE